VSPLTNIEKGNSMKISKIVRSGSLVAAACLFTQSTLAVPLYYAPTDSYYEVVFSSLINWSDARTAAESASFLGRPGRLATITSSGENNFVVSNFLTPGAFGQTAWLGGYQPLGDVGDPSGGWEWINGETWSFTNWLASEPNDSGGSEDYLQLCSAAQGGQWNDHDAGGTGGSSRYVIEYATVPEPSSFALAGIGAAMLLIRGRLKSR
jgi:hypothetical protein